MIGLFFSLLLALATPCQTEDSINCYWDAAHHGNGLGHSLVNFGTN